MQRIQRSFKIEKLELSDVRETSAWLLALVLLFVAFNKSKTTLPKFECSPPPPPPVAQRIEVIGVHGESLDVVEVRSHGTVDHFGGFKRPSEPEPNPKFVLVCPDCSAWGQPCPLTRVEDQFKIDATDRGPEHEPECPRA